MGSRSPFEGGGHTRLQLQGGPRARGWFWGAGQGAGGWARKHGCHLANWPSPDLGSGEPERRWGPAAAAAEPLGQGGLSAQPSSLPAPPPLPAPGCPRLRRGGGGFASGGKRVGISALAPGLVLLLLWGSLELGLRGLHCCRVSIGPGAAAWSVKRVNSDEQGAVWTGPAFPNPSSHHSDSAGGPLRPGLGPSACPPQDPGVQPQGPGVQFCT